MSYRQKQEVKEDMVVSKSSPGGRHIFTGGESVLQLPFTISFKDTGDYTVHIDHGQVSVNKIK